MFSCSTIRKWKCPNLWMKHSTLCSSSFLQHFHSQTTKFFNSWPQSFPKLQIYYICTMHEHQHSSLFHHWVFHSTSSRRCLACGKVMIVWLAMIWMCDALHGYEQDDDLSQCFMHATLGPNSKLKMKFSSSVCWRENGAGRNSIHCHRIKDLCIHHFTESNQRKTGFYSCCPIHYAKLKYRKKIVFFGKIIHLIGVRVSVCIFGKVYFKLKYIYSCVLNIFFPHSQCYPFGKRRGEKENNFKLKSELKIIYRKEKAKGGVGKRERKSGKQSNLSVGKSVEINSKWFRLQLTDWFEQKKEEQKSASKVKTREIHQRFHFSFCVRKIFGS